METFGIDPIPAEILSRTIKTKNKFNPLWSYGDWVNISCLVMSDGPREPIMKEVRAIQREQIEACIPKEIQYWRCIEFKNSQRLDTLEYSFAWLYTPDFNAMHREVMKIIRKLAEAS